MNNPTIFDNLIALYASLPKPQYKAIVITRLLPDAYSANYEGDTYLLIGRSRWLRIQNEIERSEVDIRSLYIPPQSVSLYGMPVIEDEELVKKILENTIKMMTESGK